jgi:hypothetical protein
MTAEQSNFLTAFKSKNRNFEMFTAMGNRKVQSITATGIRKIFAKKKITQAELLEYIGKKLAKLIDNPKYDEVTDSEPPYHIKYYLMKAVDISEYSFDFDRFDITDAAHKAKKNEL